MQVRVVMTNHAKVCTREELSTVERSFGEAIVLKDVDAEWAGYAVSDDTFRLNAQWLVETTNTQELCDKLLRDTHTTSREVTLFLVDDEEAEEPVLATFKY